MVSSLTTALFTLISFYIDYRTEVGSLTDTLTQIEQSALGGFSTAVFNLDDNQINVLLEGIVTIPDILEATVLEVDKSVYLKKTTENLIHSDAPNSSDSAEPSNQFIINYIKSFLDKNELIKLIPLKYEEGNTFKTIGFLEYRATLKNMYARLIYKAIIFFLSQGMKTFIVSFLILLICRNTITHHIQTITDFFKGEDFKSPDLKIRPLTLNRKKGKTIDEFDILVSNIVEMYAAVKVFNKENAMIINDIDNELQQQKAAAINAARLSSLGEMAGGLAHEINNPLTIIQGHTNLLKKVAINDSGKSKLLTRSIDKINDTILRISEITNGLLAFSREMNNDDYSIIKLSTLVEKIDRVANLIFRNREIGFNSTITDGDLLLKCREGQLIQVFSNLFNNAKDAIFSSGIEDKWIRLEASFSSKSNRIELRIIDSGNGIPQDIQDKILEPFFTTKAIGQGTGLGLSISHGIIQEHEGTLEVDNSCDNTCFKISLPYFKDSTEKLPPVSDTNIKEAS